MIEQQISHHLLNLLEENPDGIGYFIDSLVQESKWSLEVGDPRAMEVFFTFRSPFVPEQRPNTFYNFWASGYKCPRCDARLYKTTFPPGKEQFIPVETGGNKITEGNKKLLVELLGDEGKIPVARIFTCPACYLIFAAPIKYMLKDGVYLRYAADANSQDLITGIINYNFWITHFNSIGTLGGINNQ